MVSKKVLVGASIVGAFMVGGAAVASVTDRDFRSVTPVDLSDVQVAASVPETENSVADGHISVNPGDTESPLAPISASGQSGQTNINTEPSGVIPGLAERRGILQLFGDDFYLDNHELDFGPDRWMISTIASGDLDNDGNTESWWNEVNGAVGRNINVLGDVDDDDIDVFQINGLSVRPLDRPAPWSRDYDKENEDDSGTRIPVTTAIDVNQASKIALEQVPGTIIAVDLDTDDGVVYWEIEVRSTDGSLYDIEIDATTGRVIEVDRD